MKLREVPPKEGKEKNVRANPFLVGQRFTPWSVRHSCPSEARISEGVGVQLACAGMKQWRGLGREAWLRGAKGVH